MKKKTLLALACTAGAVFACAAPQTNLDIGVGFSDSQPGSDFTIVNDQAVDLVLDINNRESHAVHVLAFTGRVLHKATNSTYLNLTDTRLDAANVASGSTIQVRHPFNLLLPPKPWDLQFNVYVSYPESGIRVLQLSPVSVLVRDPHVPWYDPGFVSAVSVLVLTLGLSVYLGAHVYKMLQPPPKKLKTAASVSKPAARTTALDDSWLPEGYRHN